MLGEPKELDFGKKELGKNLEERAVEGEKIGDTFRKEFPTVFGILNKGIDSLKKDTPEIKEKYPKELIDKITKIVRDGGFDDFLVDSGDKAVPIGTRFSF